MFHEKRRYCVADVPDAETLADKLTQHYWTTCTGFRLGTLLFLNDSTSPDGAQEYAVFQNGRKIESITFSWCSEEKALDYIRQLQAGTLGADYGPMVVGAIQTPDEHGTCFACA